MDTSQASGEVRGRGLLWRQHLLGSEGPLRIFSAWKGKLDESNQRVIRADAERTRSDMEFFRQPALRDKMEAMLTCWCQERKVKYKQGLNEVLAPFLYLQAPEHQDLHETPTDDEVFDLFVSFVRNYTPFFSSDEFVPLQCAFIFFRRLLLYHRPDLHNLLGEKDVTPDMFCMPWFLTLFASKTPMRLAIQLWDRLLDRGEPDFIIFLSAAVLVLAEKEILKADRSALPEILTSLGVNSREDLESLWSCAEGLFMQTPSSFVQRVRKLMQKAQAADAGRTFLENAEKEGFFFILREEVVGHCYPARPGEERKEWQPSPYCPWRLLLLDVRPATQFEAERLPAAVHLDVASLLPQAPWTSGRKLLQWGKDGAGTTLLQPAQVIEALKETLGEDWICDSQAHICLLGRGEDVALLRHLYGVLTKDLTLRHISVASGGFQAVVECAQRNGYEIIRSEPAVGEALDRGPMPSAAAAAEGAAAAAAAAAETAASKLSAVLSSLKRATAGVRPSEESSQGGGEPTPGSEASPVILDRPGNWSEKMDLERLPRCRAQELRSLSWCWSCVALAIRPPQDAEASSTEGLLQGCKTILFIRNAMVTCALLLLEDDAVILTEFSVHSVTRVTSKRSSPQTVTLCEGQTTVLAALYFLNGRKEVQRFVAVLQSERQKAPRPPVTSEVRQPPLAPPAVALEAAAVAVAAEGHLGYRHESQSAIKEESGPEHPSDAVAQDTANAVREDDVEEEGADPPESVEQDAANAVREGDVEEKSEEGADPPESVEQDTANAVRKDNVEEKSEEGADPPESVEQE